MSKIVKVAQLGRRVVEVEIASPGIKVGEALRLAGVDPTGVDGIRLDGRPASLETPLDEGDVITLVPMIIGGR